MHELLIKQLILLSLALKTHIALSDERVITAAVVRTSEKNQETGMEIETVSEIQPIQKKIIFTTQRKTSSN